MPRAQVASAVHDDWLVVEVKFTPAVHAVQVRLFDAEPATLMYVPAAQVLNAAQVAVLTVLNVPFGQFAHTVFAVGVPAVFGVVPAGQTVQVAQLSAFSVEVKLPAAQSLQVRLVVVVPGVATYLPATQVVVFTHGVADEPSSSQVPAGQATGGLLPPLQEVPAGQAVQAGGVLTVAGVVSYVPGAQVIGAEHSWTFGVTEFVPAGQAPQVRSSLALGALVM